jgi:thiamine kinase-like enzyme
LAGSGLADEVVAFDGSGRRVTVFHEDARVADVADDSDMAVAMGLARRVHGLGLTVGRRFAFGEQIALYRRLCEGAPSPFPRLERQERRTARLLDFQRQLGAPETLCHGDMTADNVLVLPGGQARLIDWEFACQGDPLGDVASYCMYASMGRGRAEGALRLYLGREPSAAERARLYLHFALGGHAWALWAHYMCQTGLDLVEYGARTYAYALEYYPALTGGGLMERALEEARGKT